MESGDHGWCSHILQVLVLSWLSRRTSATGPTAATFCLPPPLARAQLGQRQCSRIQRAVHITPSCGLFTTTMALPSLHCLPSPAQAMARCDVPPCWACHAVQQYLNPLGCSEFLQLIHRGSNTTRTRSAVRGQAADLPHSPTKKSARCFIVSVRFACALCAVSQHPVASSGICSAWVPPDGGTRCYPWHTGVFLCVRRRKLFLLLLGENQSAVWFTICCPCGLLYFLLEEKTRNTK